MVMENQLSRCFLFFFIGLILRIQLILKMLLDITIAYDLLDILQLQNHIKSYNNRFSNVIDGCAYEEITRKLTIVSKETLTVEDVDDLTTAVSTYTNSPIPQETRIINTGLQKIEIDSYEFRTIFDYTYQKTDKWDICHFDIQTIAISKQNNLSYTIRIVNVTTNEVIGIETFNNRKYFRNIVDINHDIEYSEIQNLEIQIKINSPGILSVLSAYIKEIESVHVLE